MIVDPHHHFWHYTPEHFAWIDTNRIYNLGLYIGS